MPKRTHIVFQKVEAVGHIGNHYGAPRRKVTVGVYIDMDDLNRLIMKAAKNKGRKAHDGALYVEVHSIEPTEVA